MSLIARRTAFAARRAPLWTARRTYADNPAGKAHDFAGDEPEEKKVNLKEGAKRDPELFVREYTSKPTSPYTHTQLTFPSLRLRCRSFSPS